MRPGTGRKAGPVGEGLYEPEGSLDKHSCRASCQKGMTFPVASVNLRQFRTEYRGRVAGRGNSSVLIGVMSTSGIPRYWTILQGN